MYDKIKKPNYLHILMKKIKNINVSIMMGNIAALTADAVVVPEFPEVASYDGVGGALCAKGYEEGIENYASFLDNTPDPPFGTVVHTQSGGEDIPYMLHAVCVGASKEVAFRVTSVCVQKALELAQQHGYKKILMPALGTSLNGFLTDEQSARAMLNGIAGLNADTTEEMEVVIVIHYNSIQKETFERVLESFDPSHPTTVKMM